MKAGEDRHFAILFQISVRIILPTSTEQIEGRKIARSTLFGGLPSEYKITNIDMSHLSTLPVSSLNKRLNHNRHISFKFDLH
jgi:hypothetical protein